MDRHIRNKLIFFNFLQAVFTVCLSFQTCLLLFVWLATSINGITDVDLYCNMCSFLFSVVIANLINLFARTPQFSGSYWYFLAGLFVFMIISYNSYFFDWLSFYPGFLFSLPVVVRVIINIIVQGLLLYWISYITRSFSVVPAR